MKKLNNLIESPQRRHLIKTGAKTAIIAAAMVQFGGLIETLEASTTTTKKGADLIYLNGKVYTGNKKQKWAEAFAIKGDKFMAVGSNEEILKLRSKDTQVVDLRDHLVLPGLIDDHMHPDMAAENYFNVQIDELSTSYEEFKASVLKEIKENPQKKWVFGGNLDYLWDDGSDIKMFGKPSHKSIIDDIVSDKPAYFWEASGHAALVNSKALEVCGITKDTPDPKGGHYVKDANGELTGVLRETAAHVVWEKYLEHRLPSEVIAKTQIKPVFHYLNSMGLTSISDVWAREWYVQSYNILDRADELSLRVAVYVTDPIDWTSDWMKELAMKPINNPKAYTTDNVSILGVKFVLDGAAAGRTAKMLDPYEGSKDDRGPWRVEPEYFKKQFMKYDKMGHTVKAHCAGDAANRLVLDTIEEARAKHGNNHIRHSTAHTGILHPDDMGRHAKLDAVAEFSPVFWYKMAAVDVIADDIGKERLNWLFRVREMIDSGAHVSIGTDWTVTPVDPWIAMETIVTRKSPGVTDGEAFNPKERITLEEALNLYTMGAAYGQYRENEIGSIERGKYADFIVTKQNIFEEPIHKLHKTKILSTVVGGKDVFISAEVQKIIDLGEICGRYRGAPCSDSHVGEKV